MHMLFPLSFNLNNGSSLLKSVIIYLLAAVFAGWASSLLGHIALLGWLIGLLMWFVQIYCAIGTVLALLSYFKVIN